MAAESEEIREVARAFSMVDRDGSGNISPEELRNVLRGVYKSDVSEADVYRMMQQIDKDQNGEISKEEFLEAIMSWLQADKSQSTPTTPSRKRKHEGDREEIHKRIKRFFGQFKSGKSHDEVRRHVVSELEEDCDQMALRLSGDSMNVLLYSSQKKLEGLDKARVDMENFDAMVIALNSADPMQLMQATVEFAQLFSIVEIFSLASERRLIAGLLVAMFENAIGKNVPFRMSELMFFAGSPSIQVESCRFLTYFVSGPRVAGCPVTSPLSPQNGYFKKVMGPTFLEKLMQLIHSSADQLLYQALCCFGVMVSTHAIWRDYALSKNAAQMLVSVLDKNVNSHHVCRIMSYVLSVLCGATHKLDSLPPTESVTVPLSALVTMLRLADDEDVKCNACNALKLHLGSSRDPQILSLLVEILGNCPSDLVRVAVLDTIGVVINQDEQQYRYLVREKNLLSGLYQLLENTSASGTHKRIVQMLCQIAGKKRHIDELCVAKVPVVMVRFLATEKSMRREVVDFLLAVSHGNYEDIAFLVKAGAVGELANALSYFKTYDDILANVYQFSGASYDFHLVRKLIFSLINIINAGMMHSEETRERNHVGLVYDIGVVEKIGDLIQVLTTDDSGELKAWRTGGDGQSLEESTKLLLNKIHGCHRKNKDDARSANVCGRIEEIWKKHFADTSETYKHDKVVIRCYYKDDPVVVAEISTAIKYNEFQKTIDGRYERAMKISFRSVDDGETISIDCDVSLKQALKQAEKERTLRIRVTDKFNTSSQSNELISGNLFEWSDTLKDEKKNLEDVKMEALASKQKGNPSELFPGLKLEQVSAGEFFSMGDELKALERDEQNNNLTAIQNQTNYSLEELRKIHSHWKNISGKDGKLTKAQFADGMKNLGLTDPLMIELNFRAFDKDKSGMVDFQEYVTGLSVFQKGNPEDRLRLMFDVYDSDDSGTLTFDEVFNLFRTGEASRGRPSDMATIKKLAEECMNTADENNDGVIDFAEFKNAVLLKKILIEAPMLC